MSQQTIVGFKISAVFQQLLEMELAFMSTCPLALSTRPLVHFQVIFKMKDIHKLANVLFQFLTRHASYVFAATTYSKTWLLDRQIAAQAKAFENEGGLQNVCTKFAPLQGKTKDKRAKWT